MTSTQKPPDDIPPAPVRRPPRPQGGWATVTTLTPGSKPGPAPGSTPGSLPREPVPLAAVQGTLALDLSGSSGAPCTPELRVVAGDVPGGDLQEVRVWAARFAQAVVEALGADRPLSQLVRWTSARVYHDLERRVRVLARTSPAPARRRTVRPQVRSVHVFQPSPDTAEVSVHVRYGPRSRALAARLERVRGRWQCTALQLG